jgi:NADPH:quinone reductase-like Zn-dependent oxidoreductase
LLKAGAWAECLPAVGWRDVRAAIIDRIGEPPRLGEMEEPVRESGKALIQVAAASINPLDLAIASGRYYGGSPEPPYVPGTEGVGAVLEADSVSAGIVVRFEARSGRYGSLAERAIAPEETLIELPKATYNVLAAAIGVAGLAAWLALDHRGKLAEGETVLVLGASGAVGQIAVQAAKILGAGTVIAVARSADGLRRARELGADATVELGSQGPDQLSSQFREAAGGEIDLVVDPLWGAPAVAALQTLRTGGRLVNLGQSAGAEAVVSSAAVRSRSRSIVGHANAMTPRDVKRDAYLTLLEHAREGRLTVDFEVMPLEEITRAWELQASSPHRKIVVRPG